MKQKQKTLADFVEPRGLRLYAEYEVSFAGENKWRCPYCGFSDNAKTNANWVRDRLFRCAGCGRLIEGLGRVWWKVPENLG